jgi:hypothetical protein
MTFRTVATEDIQPRYEEVPYVIKCLRNHKAPGTAQIIAELLKKKEERIYGEESLFL